jgi:hypothetical protein
MAGEEGSEEGGGGEGRERWRRSNQV